MAAPLAMAFVLAGCGMFASLDLTEEESGLIAEYAAGLLKKYDRNGTRLLNPDAIREEEVPEEIPEEVPEEEPAAPEESTPEETMPSEEEPEPDTEDEPEAEAVSYATATISECLGLSGIDIEYQDYELCDRYPEQPDNSWLISMAAPPGQKLVVVRFSLTNDTDDTMSCDILNAGKLYRLLVNGGKRVNETVTVLMDSFSQFNETLDAGETQEAVLIFELDEEEASSLSSLDLVIKDDAGSDTFKLF